MLSRLHLKMPRDGIVANLTAGVIVSVVAIPFAMGATAPARDRPCTRHRQSPRLAPEDAPIWARRCTSRGPAYCASGAARSRTR